MSDTATSQRVQAVITRSGVCLSSFGEVWPYHAWFSNVLPVQLLDKLSIHLLRKSYKIHRESILRSNLPSPPFFLAVLFASQQSKHTCFHEQHQPWPLHASHSYQSLLLRVIFSAFIDLKGSITVQRAESRRSQELKRTCLRSQINGLVL